MGLLKLLSEKERFSPAEQQIIDYLLKNYREVAELSARQLAEKTYTSSAAVVRFCQKLGLKGYADFKIKFVVEAMRDIMENKEKQSITNKDTIVSIISKVARIEGNALEETRRNIDPADIMRAAHLIEHAEHMEFYALGNNVNLAELAGYCFLHAGKFSTVQNKANVQYLQAISAPKTHIGFFISRTGENRRLIELAEILKERGRKFILLTANRDSSLGRRADVTLSVATEKNFDELGTLVFLSGAKYMIDVLYSVLFARHYDLALSRNESYSKIFSCLN